jgi:hypothetical protein
LLASAALLRAQSAAEITAGVDEIAAPGVPGFVTVYGANAEAVAVGATANATRSAVLAVATAGLGRVGAFSHDGYLASAAFGAGQTQRLLLNLARWASRKDSPRVGAIGAPDIVTMARANNLQADAATADNAASFDVVFVRGSAYTRADAEKLRDYVDRGGGLIAAATGWGWAQLNPNLTLRDDAPFNTMFAGAGIQWTDGTVSRTTANGFTTRVVIPRAVHAESAWTMADSGAAPTAAERNQLSQTLTQAVRFLPREEPVWTPRLTALFEREVVPSARNPIGAARMMDRLAIAVQSQVLDETPAQEVRAHKAAAVFPGAVASDAARVSRQVKIALHVPDRHSLGLYAAAGEPLRIEIPASATGLGLRVRIGAHSDNLFNVDTWRRMPVIARTWPLNKRETIVASPYGGVVYIESPRGRTGEIEVAIEGAVEAPLYISGVTDPAEWNTIRERPGPWAEIGSDRMIVTVPSELVRGIDDPEHVARTWIRLLDLAADLAQIPIERARPERFVTDEQISAGYMHAGYPLMCHLDQAANLADPAHILTAGNWGFFHEVGHNHQSADWTFDGTIEVTVNLFSLYIYEHLTGIPPKRHPRGNDAFLREQMAKYDFARPDFEKWKADPFLALAMYVQLQHAFGWDTYKSIFAKYLALPAAERPRNDAEKRDQWLTRYSREVGRNLGPFFQKWGVPVSAEALRSVEGLPVWMPEGW